MKIFLLSKLWKRDILQRILLEGEKNVRNGSGDLGKVKFGLASIVVSGEGGGEAICIVVRLQVGGIREEGIQEVKMHVDGYLVR